MEYLQVSWIHDFDDEPILYYSELDWERYEVRKLEIYKDGSFGLACKEFEFGGALLSEGPVPGIDEISADPQFVPKAITKDTFDDVWAQYNNFLKS